MTPRPPPIDILNQALVWTMEFTKAISFMTQHAIEGSFMGTLDNGDERHAKDYPSMSLTAWTAGSGGRPW
ncbi:hypothetical protein BGW39_001304, partial [Mortierella sp. 14UC]